MSPFDQIQMSPLMFGRQINGRGGADEFEGSGSIRGQQVTERTMGQPDAAIWLNISVRQVKRLVRAIRQDGAQGAVSKRWGVPSNRRIAV